MRERKPKIVIIVGSPKGGKTTYAHSERFKSFEYIDPKSFKYQWLDIKSFLHTQMGHHRDIIIDDCNGTFSDRFKWLSLIKAYPQSQRAPKYVLEVHWIVTDLVDVKENNKRSIATGGSRWNKIEVLSYRRNLEPPMKKEGFDLILRCNFKSLFNEAIPNGQHKAVFFSLPSIMTSIRGDLFPSQPKDVLVFPEVNNVFERYFDEGYLFCGIANLPYIGLRQITFAAAQECLIEIIKKLSVPIEKIYYSPYTIGSLNSLNLPNPTLAFQAKEDYSINLSKSVMVGTSSVDKEFAKNASIGEYIPRTTFFYEGKRKTSKSKVPNIEERMKAQGVS